MEANLLPSIQVSIFKIDCSEVKRTIREIYESVCKALTDVIANRASKKVQEIDEKFAEVQREISKEPKDIESL